MLWTITLPAVKRSEPKPETQKMNVIEKTSEAKVEDGDDDSAENNTEVNRSEERIKKINSIFIFTLFSYIVLA